MGLLDKIKDANEARKFKKNELSDMGAGISNPPKEV